MHAVKRFDKIKKIDILQTHQYQLCAWNKNALSFPRYASSSNHLPCLTSGIFFTLSLFVTVCVSPFNSFLPSSSLLVLLWWFSSAGHLPPLLLLVCATLVTLLCIITIRALYSIGWHSLSPCALVFAPPLTCIPPIHICAFATLH